MCEHCSDLQISFDIRSPGDLKKAIKVIKANLEDGTLEEILNGSTIGSEELLSETSNEPSWPDYFEIHFQCRHCGTRFRLEAETYHGSGGSWSVEKEGSG